MAAYFWLAQCASSRDIVSEKSRSLRQPPQYNVRNHLPNKIAHIMSDKKLSEYVTLVSCDGFEFIVRRSAATIAKTIHRMLDPASESSVLNSSVWGRRFKVLI